MKLEISPEPTPQERAAIVAALAQAQRDEAAASQEAPQEFLTNRQDSVRP